MNKQQLGMRRRITRRDFLNGVLQTAAASAALPLLSFGSVETSEEYPPALTGLRGSSVGSFEAAHHLRDGDLWDLYPETVDTKEKYDLVIVGAGISGLSAAWFFRKATGNNTRILLLDNHDDFGGHARRQEFGGGISPLLTFGGSYAIESPAPYSEVARGLVEELGIDVPKFSDHFQRNLYQSIGLKAGFFFDQATFGSNLLLPDPYAENYRGAAETSADAWERFAEKAPMSDAAKRDLQRIFKDKTDYMPGLTSDEKKAKLARMSYAEFLTDVAKCDAGVLPFFQARPQQLYGAGIDIVPAQDAWGLGFPGFQGMNLDPAPGIGMNRDSIPNEEAENYFFHFPDGNASIARMLVRKLIPQSIPGKSADDIVTARARYSKLDDQKSASRIRLSSTVVRVKHKNGSEVEIAYVKNAKLQTVIASKCILACWHTIIPYLCPELPRDQKTALSYAIKVPLVYAKVAVRNWLPWKALRIQSIYAPGSYFSFAHLAMPLVFPGYKSVRTPEEPVAIGLVRTPCRPGLPVRHQHRVGRSELFETPFEMFEQNIREQMNAMLSSGGFDASRDITGIAVHRWPHGYAYQYNSLFDPFWLEGKEGPCVLARQPFGRVAIANSDAAAYAYADSAIDEGHRAVQEILAMK
jgi:spermidine dehydrogenase